MKFAKEVKVGLFMVIALTLLYFGFNYLRGIEFFNTTNKFYAKYSNVGGLTVSNPVTISGYSVGRVSKILILQIDSNKVLVELDIDGDIILGEGAEATLDIGLLGETAITIAPGNFDSPLAPNDTINAKLGTTLAESMANIAEPVARDLQSTIVRVNTILDNLTGSSDKINNIIANVEETTLQIKYMSAETRKSLSEVTNGYRTTVANLNDKIDQITPLMNKYGAVADSLSAINVKPAIAAAEKTIKDLDALILKIDQSQGTLTLLIEDRDLYDNLNKTISDLDNLIIHMEKRPKDFFKPLGRDRPKGVK
ncbi:MAG: MlaD family protein [Cyclobacteriaceae bacterium]|nr:MlaD family protein [Cyclobacteriaceae bacterium]